MYGDEDGLEVVETTVCDAEETEGGDGVVEVDTDNVVDAAARDDRDGRALMTKRVNGSGCRDAKSLKRRTEGTATKDKRLMSVP